MWVMMKGTLVVLMAGMVVPMQEMAGMDVRDGVGADSGGGDDDNHGCEVACDFDARVVVIQSRWSWWF